MNTDEYIMNMSKIYEFVLILTSVFFSNSRSFIVNLFKIYFLFLLMFSNHVASLRFIWASLVVISSMLLDFHYFELKTGFWDMTISGCIQIELFWFSPLCVISKFELTRLYVSDRDCILFCVSVCRLLLFTYFVMSFVLFLLIFCKGLPFRKIYR